MTVVPVKIIFCRIKSATISNAKRKKNALLLLKQAFIIYILLLFSFSFVCPTCWLNSKYCLAESCQELKTENENFAPRSKLKGTTKKQKLMQGPKAGLDHFAVQFAEGQSDSIDAA